MLQNVYAHNIRASKCKVFKRKRQRMYSITKRIPLQNIL